MENLVPLFPFIRNLGKYKDMLLKYILLAVVAYMVYKGLNPLKKVQAPEQEESSSDFVDYEEIDD